jgi:hypothetical protein
MAPSPATCRHSSVTCAGPRVTPTGYAGSDPIFSSALLRCPRRVWTRAIAISGALARPRNGPMVFARQSRAGSPSPARKEFMATYLLVFLGMVAIASTAVGLIGASVVAATEWILRQLESRRGAPAYHYAHEQPPFIADDEFDVHRPATPSAYYARLR